MPFFLTKTNVENLKTDAKVIGSCPYRNTGRNQGWHPDLWAEQRRISELAPGESMVTGGIEFDAKYGIITKPPIWEGGQRKEDMKLALCYESALRLAHRRRCRSIAFPLLSADCHGFPKDLAIHTAIATIREFLDKFEMTVYLSVREPSALKLFDDHSTRLLKLLEESDESPVPEFLAAPDMAEPEAEIERAAWNLTYSSAEALPKAKADMPMAAVPRKLKHLMEEKEETFSQRLLRLIDEKGLKDPQVYKKANLDRRLFSKIRSHSNYQPSRQTALALALALELNLDETRDFIGKAGYTLTHSSKSDIILEYFISENNYDIYEINQILFAFDQPLIGG